MIHEPPKQLHRNILEGKRRAMEQLKHELVGIGLDDRTDGSVSKRGVCLIDNCRELVRLDFITDEGRQQAFGQFGIGKPTHRADFGSAENRPFLGDVKAAIARQAGEQHIGKTQPCRGSSGTDIVHFDWSGFLLCCLPAFEKPYSFSRFPRARLI